VVATETGGLIHIIDAALRYILRPVVNRAPAGIPLQWSAGLQSYDAYQITALYSGLPGESVPEIIMRERGRILKKRRCVKTENELVVLW